MPPSSGRVQPRWSVCARLLLAAGWMRLPERVQEGLIDCAAGGRAAAVWLWLAFLSLATVRADPMGWARRPIPVRVGRARAPAAVHIMAATTPLQHRLIAYFWRNPHDHTCQQLLALSTHYGGDPAEPIDVSGAIVFPLARGARRILPLAFRLQIDLEARTFTLTHSRLIADEKTGSAICTHEAVGARMNSADVTDVLAPLLARRSCPALRPGSPSPIAPKYE